MKKRSPEVDRSEVDLTPMLDVVFIMLIFFVVTASFIKESSLPVYTPEDQPNVQPPIDGVQNLLIHISSSNEISINQRRVDIRAVRSLVARHLAENPGTSVVIRAHEQAKTDTYVAVADQAKQAGQTSLMLVTYVQ